MAHKNKSGTINLQETASVTSTVAVPGDDDEALFDETAGAYKTLRATTEEIIIELMVGRIKEELKSYSKMLVRITASYPNPTWLTVG